MKRRAKQPIRKSFDEALRERALALSDRVREDDKRHTALAGRLEQSQETAVGLKVGLFLPIGPNTDKKAWRPPLTCRKLS